MINTDLKANPLKEGETISLIGYSGGGQLALNVMGYHDIVDVVKDLFLYWIFFNVLEYEVSGE